MNINWQVRLKNKYFWITLVPLLLLLVQAIGDLFGLQVSVEGASEKLLAIVNLIFAILAALGIVNDPTTKGINDSTRALNYKEPN